MASFLWGVAVSALVKLGDAAIEPLIAIHRSGNPDLQWIAAEALKQIKEKQITTVQLVEPLVIRLKDGDSNARKAAAETLGEIGSEETLAPLVAALRDEDGGVRLEVARALRKIGDVRAVEPLIIALKDSDLRVRREASVALGVISDGRAIEPLMAILKDKDNNHRERAGVAEALVEIGIALWKSGDARAVEPLIDGIKKYNAGYYVGQAAAQALGEIGDARAVEPLMDVLKSVNQKSLWPTVGQALGEIGYARAVEPLIAALKNSDRDVWRLATEALISIGNIAVEPLIEALKNSDRDVWLGAAVALRDIGDVRVLGPLARYAVHKMENWGYGGREIILSFVELFERLLETKAAEIEPGELRLIAVFKDLRWTLYESRSSATGCDHSDPFYTVHVSWARVRQLARQELIRRGLQA